MYDYLKAANILAFFAEKENKEKIINKMKALKLFYFADRIHLQKYGTPICFDKPIYVNMDYGPVNSCVKDISELNQDNLSEESIKEIEKIIIPLSEDQYGKRRILFLKAVCSPDLDYLSKVNLEVLENVWTTFGSLNEFSLSELTHYYPGWKNWYSYYDNESFFTPIDPEKRKEILKKFNVLDPLIDNELLKDSKDIAIERGIIHECNFLNQVEM